MASKQGGVVTAAAMLLWLSAALVVASGAALQAPAATPRRPSSLLASVVSDASDMRALMPAQGALLVAKWKSQVENEIALGFLPQHTHPDRSVQRIMFVKKAFDRAYADMRTFAAASQAGDAAVAKLERDLSTAQIFGNLRNSETQAAALALVLDRDATYDVLHVVMTPDCREPEKITTSEAAFLAALKAESSGKPTRLSAAAAEALLGEPADLGFRDGDDADWLVAS